MSVRTVRSAETRPLRLDVLRPGQPAESAVYPGDDDPTTVHVAAEVDGEVVGIASLYLETRPGQPGEGWRLRGMATHPSVRGSGVGARLLQAIVEHVASHGGGEVWCNARTPAAAFYVRSGFSVVGEPFDIEGIGPHVVMRRVVAPSP